ncbi:MAG: hypothetical protein WAJ87_16290, partial [Bryobacteraceae bacterium]
MALEKTRKRFCTVMLQNSPDDSPSNAKGDEAKRQEDRGAKRDGLRELPEQQEAKDTQNRQVRYQLAGPHPVSIT